MKKLNVYFALSKSRATALLDPKNVDRSRRNQNRDLLISNWYFNLHGGRDRKTVVPQAQDEGGDDGGYGLYTSRNVEEKVELLRLRARNGAGGAAVP